MEIQCSQVKKYKITYEVGGFLFFSIQEGVDSKDAQRRFEERTGFNVISTEAA